MSMARRTSGGRTFPLLAGTGPSRCSLDVVLFCQRVNWSRTVSCSSSSAVRRDFMVARSLSGLLMAEYSRTHNAPPTRLQAQAATIASIVMYSVVSGHGGGIEPPQAPPLGRRGPRERPGLALIRRRGVSRSPPLFFLLVLSYHMRQDERTFTSERMFTWSGKNPEMRRRPLD